ncbi:MAG: sensor histidine kinase [Micrococcales bacterium]|nr:sensor histidine kinase [Micrococcales bacterium]
MKDLTRPDTPASPWERHGWVMGAIWLVFLGFPLYAAAVRPGPVWLRVVGVLLTVAFAVVYIIGFAGLSDEHDGPWWSLGRRGWWSIPPARAALLLCLIAAAMIAIIELEALGTIIFIVALATATLPTRQGVVALLLGITAAPLIGWGLGDLLTGVWFSGMTALIGTFMLLLGRFETLDRQAALSQRQLAFAEERDRVARDVHDVLGHSLTVLTVKSEVAERMVDLDPERAKEELAQIRSISRQALAEIRATVAGLRVARLTDEVDHAESALTAAGIESELPEDAMVVDPRHRITLAWALREAVTNVVRHSGAEHCAVEWGADWLEVTDDGRGLNGSREGNGIRGLRERVEPSGGAVTVSPGPGGRGTRLRIELGVES